MSTVSSGGVPTPTPQDHECDGTSTCPATDHVDDCVGAALQARWCDEHGQPGLTCSDCASESGVTPQEPEITSDMISAGAKGLTGRSKSGDVYSIVVADSVMAIRIAEQVLSAALAGRTEALPEPTGRWSDGVPYWDAEGRTIAAQVDDNGRPYTRLNGQIWLVTEAEAVGLALVAAAREARRLASGSRKDEETRECPAHGAHPHDGMKCLDCPLCVEGGAS